MNKTSIKNYAIWARNELISRVSQKAFEYGVEKDNIVSSNTNDINGRLLSNDEKKKRQILIKEVNQKGFDQVMEEVAYTWFNRFIALRFMEVNNYLPKKIRVFTNDNNEFKPQIMDEALHVELLGLDKNKVIALKEDNNDEELYKELLLATCNDMSQYLPGMFKPIDDYMTLLFPSNLFREESVLGRLISDIDEDSWNDQVQIIGWLYQYYNTELKDEAFADLKKNVKINKQTIAPVTQIFTPNWIVGYMTENSLGHLWFNGHPESEIKTNWKYYIDETDQNETVQMELNNIREKHARLKPEDIKFFDPCMGSGHILVYAFDVFIQIYVSEGWSARDAVKSILKNNIYGLDIDERAYQLSYFALMMKARQYNRRILSERIIPNVMAIEESNTFKRELLNHFEELKPLANKVLDMFVDAKEYGSTLNIKLTKKELDSLESRMNRIDKIADCGNILERLEKHELFHDFYPILKQAKILSQKYECVVTNPPYMGANGMSNNLAKYVAANYADSKNDLFAVFIERCHSLTIKNGYFGMIVQPSFLTLQSYAKLRRKILVDQRINSMLHMGRGIFGIDFGSVSFVMSNHLINNYRGHFFKLHERTFQYIEPTDIENLFLLAKSKDIKYSFTNYDAEFGILDKDINCQSGQKIHFIANENMFSVVPETPFTSYELTEHTLMLFTSDNIVKDAKACIGMRTGNNEKFLRLWFEVPVNSVMFNGNSAIDIVRNKMKWIPYNKGGDYRKWYGNQVHIVNWENNGKEIKENTRKVYPQLGDNLGWKISNESMYCKSHLAWSDIASKGISFRFFPDGFIFDASANVIFCEDKYRWMILGYINSVVVNYLSKILNPTMHFKLGNFNSLPYIRVYNPDVEEKVLRNISISKADWDENELSWNFTKLPYIDKGRINCIYSLWNTEKNKAIEEYIENEKEINTYFINVYKMHREINLSVMDFKIDLRIPEIHKDIKLLISYAVGCMFGRYSLDLEGLVYAGGEWDSNKYNSFIPDTDNIIPICDDEYFEDDIVGRFIEFIKVAYGKETLEDNLQFISDALGGKGTPREVLRNYFINDFFKDHCNTYQVTGSGKRPIYWQFDSGKKNGFKALIYIHRYTPDLIARMRTEYVHEQQSCYDNQISMIQNQINSVTVTSERTRLSKKLKKLKEQAEELRIYEEKIHHWADKMEPMDLDDGVKANYAKFQELLTKIK